MQAVIMAGGKGTRLRSITGESLPKPMAPICGKPILEWAIESLRSHGVTKVILVVGYLGNVIEDYFGDGSKFDVEISYFHEEQPLGTAGAFPLMKDRLEDEFILAFGDVIFDIDLQRMQAYHREKQALATLFVHPNSHPYDSDIVLCEKDGRVKDFLSKKLERTGWYDNCVNAGFYLLNRRICDSIPGGGVKTDLEKDVLFPLARQGEAIYGYSSSEYIKDVGTPERIEKAGEELRNGVVAARCLTHPQKCIFLDRDGTINKHVGLVSKEEQLVLEECAAEAIAKANASGYLTIVVTNQPVVARGLCEVEDVERIHDKMKTLLGQQGAYVDGLYFCPHHPHKGYPEENPLYKIPCRCRKPDIGMIEQAAARYNIDLIQSYLVGDTTMDIQTGKNAGVKTILVKTGEAGGDKKYDVTADAVAENLLDAMNKILGGTV